MLHNDPNTTLIEQELHEFTREYSDYLTTCVPVLPTSQKSKDTTITDAGSVYFKTLEGQQFTATFTTAGWYVTQFKQYFESGQQMLESLSPKFREQWADDLLARLNTLANDQGSISNVRDQ